MPISLTAMACESDRKNQAVAYCVCIAATAAGVRHRAKAPMAPASITVSVPEYRAICRAISRDGWATPNAARLRAPIFSGRMRLSSRLSARTGSLSAAMPSALRRAITWLAAIASAADFKLVLPAAVRLRRTRRPSREIRLLLFNDSTPDFVVDGQRPGDIGQQAGSWLWSNAARSNRFPRAGQIKNTVPARCGNNSSRHDLVLCRREAMGGPSMSPHGRASAEPIPAQNAAMPIRDQKKGFGSSSALIRHLREPV